MNDTLSEIKKNPHGTTVKGRKPGFKSTIWNTINDLEEINSQPVQKKETRIKKKK